MALSSSSSSSAPLPAADYEVFLSFRGPDVRTNFADVLCQYLDSCHIRTFLDDVELPRAGDNIAENLFKSIEDSKVFILILSRTMLLVLGALRS
ncbi:Disease resistance protein L6 [Linum perenne]